MTYRNTDPSQGGNVNLQPPPPPPAPPDRSHGGNKVYKSGSLFLSSRGIGWTSWKKRWFILTNTSLIFFRSDPSAIPLKGSEANLTLGGIDLNNSGSVVIKADKKLLTVLFPDGRGRAFTLKAETSQDMYEWKEALEEALANAPNATTVMVQNGVFVDDQVVIADGSPKQSKERMPVKSSVIGQPILLALEDIDGTPTFLEKALRFIEEHGVKIEGILRQAADVDDIEHRVREYEQGKNEFCPEEDPHVIADCVKHVLRELPSSPVPASCCNALLEACRSDRGTRVTALRSAICETFPEPNRRLLQRILTMMQTVASHKSENRMSTSAVAACMAPLLLRSLLAGDCELENDFDVGGDGSVQLLQAAAAANHAQAIVITLLDEYENLFVAGGSMSPGIYSNSVESGSEFTDDETFEDVDDASEGSDSDAFEDFENMSGRRHSETEDDLSDHEGSERSSSGFRSPDVDNSHEDNHNFSSPQQTSSLQQNRVKGSEMVTNQGNMGLKVQAKDPSALLADKCEETSSTKKSASNNSTTCIRKSRNASNGTVRSTHRSTFWGRTPAKKNLSMESISVSSEDEAEIQRLEAAKADLQNRILEEAKGNAILQENLKKRKSALREHRLALEEDVATLQEQLQREKEFRTMLESGLKMSQKSSLPISDDMDGMMKAELEEITRAEAEIMNLKQKAGVLGVQVNQQREQNKLHKSSNQPQQTADHQVKMKDKKEDVSISLEQPTRTKDANSDEVDNGKDIKRESQPSPDEYLPQDQQYDQEHNSKYSVEPRVGKPVSNSKKSSSKGEAANSTTSALSKLTNRLNFLKERRTQITNDLVNSGQKYLDKGSSGGSESPQNSEKGGTTEGQKPHQSRDRKKRSGAAQSAPNLGRGKSESHVYVEKEPSIVPPRTYSR